MFWHIQTNLHLKLKCLKRVKVHWRYLALIPVWDIEKELFAPKLLMKLTVKYEIWGHQFFYGMIFMSCKKRLKAFLLVKFVTNFSADMNFVFWHIFLGIHNIWTLSLFLWMQLRLNKFSCFFYEKASFYVLEEK